MPTENSDGAQAPVHAHQSDPPAPAAGRSRTGNGVIALVLCAAALLSAPLLMLIPYVGFLPALLAGAAIIVAGSGLRVSGSGTAVAGPIAGVVLFAVLAGIATAWTLIASDPAIRDDDELHEGIDRIKGLVLGS